VGILAAVRHAARTGEGQRVDVNLLSSLLSALANQAQGYVEAGIVPGRMGNRHPSIAPYETFQAQDRLLVLAVGNDRQFAGLCEVLGLPAVAHDPRFATNEQRVAHREELGDHWFRALMARGVPCGPINTIEQGFALAAELGLRPVVHVPRMAAGAQEVAQDGAVTPTTVATVANPIRLSRTPAVYRSAPPLLGQNGEAGVSPCTETAGAGLAAQAGPGGRS
jgi:crotonobetainyl-CoA:carnitine CoA-transferase CaiB-like acyl-CoA transferase